MRIIYKVDEKPAEYIGDGVYILYDGFGFELRANDHKHPTDIIYLEPNVLESLIEWTEKFTKPQGETDGTN